MSCRHDMSNMSCHFVTLETDPCVCPCQYSPTHVKLPASVQSVTFNVPTPYSCSVYDVKLWLEKRPKSDQNKCHAPFSACKHVGDDMSNMSCHVVKLETDPCVCPCQYSPTHVKLPAKCHFQRSNYLLM